MAGARTWVMVLGTLLSDGSLVGLPFDTPLNQYWVVSLLGYTGGPGSFILGCGRYQGSVDPFGALLLV
eukprot:933247-Pyramimonas_sp.AAC.1